MLITELSINPDELRNTIRKSFRGRILTDKSRHCCELAVNTSWNGLGRYEILVFGRTIFTARGCFDNGLGPEEYRCKLKKMPVGHPRP
jgi:hypothetical protein